MCFFFFKQKTAYEMRISDWSSDVCSSDLDHQRKRQVTTNYRRSSAMARTTLFDKSRRSSVIRQPVGSRPDIAVNRSTWLFQDQPFRECATVPLDRKSVVEGKSVSVRVDLGGRRSIKKTKRAKNN